MKFRPLVYNDQDGLDFLYKLIGKHADNAKIYKVPEQVAANLNDITSGNEFIERTSPESYVITIRYNWREVKHAIIKDVALGWLTTMEIPRLITLLAARSNDVTPVYIEVPGSEKIVKESSLCLVVALLNQCPYPIKANLNGEATYMDYGSERLRIGSNTFDTSRAGSVPVSLSALARELSQLVPIDYHVYKFDANLVEHIDYVAEERFISEYGVAMCNFNGKSVIYKTESFILSELEQKELQRELFGRNTVDYLEEHFKGIQLSDFKLAVLNDKPLLMEEVFKLPNAESLGDGRGIAYHFKYHGVSTDFLIVKDNHGDAYVNIPANVLSMLSCNYMNSLPPLIDSSPIRSSALTLDKYYAYAIAGLYFTIPYLVMYRVSGVIHSVAFAGETLSIEYGGKSVHCNINRDETSCISTEDLYNIVCEYVPAEVQLVPYATHHVPDVAPYQVLNDLGLKLYRVDNVVFVVKKDMFVMRLAVVGYCTTTNNGEPDTGDQNISEMIDMFIALHKDGEVGVHVATLLEKLHISEADARNTLAALINEIGG